MGNADLLWIYGRLKIGVAVEEASESLEWLESLKQANIGSPATREALIDEANQLTAILAASHKTVTGRGFVVDNPNKSPIPNPQ